MFFFLNRLMCMVSLRGALRQRFGGPQANQSMPDCCLWYFCSPCVACQESKQVDEAQALKIRCCCQSSDISHMIIHQQMVGQPVGMAMPVGQPGTVTVVGQPVVGQPVGQNPRKLILCFVVHRLLTPSRKKTKTVSYDTRI